jgi:hypothetical protein
MATGLFEQIRKTSKPLPTQWERLLSPGTAQYEAAVLLNKQGKLPLLVIGKTSEASYNGEYDKKTNTVTLNPKTLEVPQTLAHELTHALGYVMKDKVWSMRDQFEKTNKQATGADAQFLNAYRKLDPDFSKLTPMKYPDQSYNEYRNSSTEAPAFAVGRMEDPRKSLTRGEYFMSSPAGMHVDATLAQEQAILRDLYGRTQVASPVYTDPMGFTIK